MLNDKVTQLLNTLNATNQEISRCADCTPSNISRLRSGARKPDPLSPTINKFINGVIHYATLHEKMDLITNLIGTERSEPEILENRIRQWLYQDEPVKDTIPLYESADNFPHSNFGKKFASAVQLSEMTNIQISHQLNVDPSLISRFLSGTRTPKSNPAMYDQLCRILFTRIMSLDKQRELIDLIQITDTNDSGKTMEYSDDYLYRLFHAWLYDFKNEDYKAIHHLLSTIESITLHSIPEIPKPPENLISRITNDDSAVYQGTEGLQTAVIRFLTSAVASNATELLLYSDQDIKWMIDDEEFCKTWACLMAACAMNGIKITIIHNIERNIKEMTDAIEAWLPLYMLGNIHPYYCNRKNGDRFTHTFFICPGVAAITSCMVKGTEENGVYQYCTVKDELSLYQKDFDALLRSCDSLASVKKETVSNNFTPKYSHDIDYQKLNMQNIKLEVNSNYVNVIKVNDPGITFTFFHPLMCEAFDSYIQSLHPEG